MDTSDTLTDLERLAAIAPGVQAVAHSVLRDGHAAEDVLQEALLTATEKGVGEAREPKRWFVGVVRNLARRALRRQDAQRRWEHRAARPESTESTSDVVARGEIHERLVHTLLALPEPYRETLMLRYFDDLEPREIAAQQGVPPGTVRSRLSRGIELLRGRLDAQERGDRRAWALALLPLASGYRAPLLATTTGLAAGTGVLLMSAKTKIAIAVAVLLIAVLFVAGVVTGDGSDSSGSSEPAVAAGEASEERPDRVELPLPTEDVVAVVDEPADDTEATHHTVVLGGLVLGVDRRPAVGALVELLHDGDEVFSARTDDNGRYAIPYSVLREITDARVTARARDDAGNIGMEVSAFRIATGPSATVKTIVLAPAHAIVVRVVDADDEPVRGARVVCREHDQVTLARGESDANGIVRFDALPKATVTLRGYAAGVGRAVSRPVVAARDGTETTLRLTKRDVRVTVTKADGSPVPGARLFARQHMTDAAAGHGPYFDPPVVSPPTDADGVTTIEDVGADDSFSLQILASGLDTLPSPWSIPLTSSSTAVGAGVTEAYMEVKEPKRLAWPIAAESPRPPSGTDLTLDVHREDYFRTAPLLGRATVENDHVVAFSDVPHGQPFRVRAIAPDGSWCELNEEKPDRPVTFVPRRVVRFRIVEADGTPAAGLSGNTYGDFSGTWFTTDENGEFEVTTLPPRRVTIGAAMHTFSGMHVANSGSFRDVEVEADAELVVVELPVARELIVRLTVDGEPGVPAELEHITTSWGRPFDAVENAETGEIRLRLRKTLRNDPCRVYAVATGFIRAEAVPEIPEEGPIGPVQLDLVRGAEFRAQLASSRPLLTRLELQKWKEGYQRWERVSIQTIRRGASSGGPVVEGDGSVLVQGLEAGRYRITATETGVASEAVDISPGVIPPVVRLSVQAQAQVSGRIEYPDGVEPDGDAMVIVEGEGFTRRGRSSSSREGVFVTKDGTFFATVPGDEEVTVRIHHPVYSPDSTEGSVRVTGERRDLVLRLVFGSTTTFAPPAGAHATSLAESVLIRFFADHDVSGEPLFQRVARLEDGSYRFGGYEPGTYVLHVDAGGFAPLVADHVQLADGQTDLGELGFSRGAGVRVVLKDGADVIDEFHVTVSSLAPDQPSFSRRAGATDAQAALVRGLVPGTYDVHAFVTGGTFRRASTQITIADADGVVDVELDLADE